MQTALFDEGGKPTIAAAQAAADRGMDLVLEHAEEFVDGWSRVAYLFLVKFARAHHQFIANECVQASVNEIEQPHSSKAWGRIFKRASAVGFIRAVGYAPAPHRHASPAVLWESALC